MNKSTREKNISIKSNVLYSGVLTVSGYLFPLITFPYVTRVLGVENLGLCNYVDSIVQYFILFSMLGIGTIAIREIAKSRNNQEELNRTYSSVMFLNLFTTIIALLVLLILLLNFDSFKDKHILFYWGAAKILFNTLLIEWFYKGIEDFKYITARSLVVRAVYVGLVFLLVKTKEDYLIYFALNTLMVIINSIINIVHARNYVHFSIKDISIRPFLKPFIILGFYNIMISMYTSFNVAYLGYISGNTEVGYYTTATKIYTIILSFFTAFTGVMLPRMSSLIAKGEMHEFFKLSNKSIEALLALIFPLAISTIVFAPEIIRIVAGRGYEGAVLPMRIVIPLMFIVGYEQIIIIQMLMPMKKDKAVLTNSIFGALVAVFANIILVPLYGSVGSAIVWVISELTVMTSAQYFVWKYTSMSFPIKRVAVRVLWSIPVVYINILIRSSLENGLLALIIGTIITFCVFFILEYRLLKNEIIVNYTNLVVNKICNDKQ